MEIQFKVNVAPRGQGRPRFARIGKGVRTYEQKKDTAFKAVIKKALVSAYAGKPLERAIRLRMVACFKVPKSYSKKRREACLSGTERPTKKPDLDNIVKAVQDAMNGTAYGDDCQVVEFTCSKVYSEEEGLKITIEEVE